MGEWEACSMLAAPWAPAWAARAGAGGRRQPDANKLSWECGGTARMVRAVLGRQVSGRARLAGTTEACVSLEQQKWKRAPGGMF